MSYLYITELESITPTQEGGAAQVARMPPVAEQTIAITGTSAQSSAFNSRTRYVRIETDVIAGIAFGPNPTAAVASGTSATATGTARMAANTVEYFGVTPGTKVAAISTT
jgi:hypothetical protein